MVENADGSAGTTAHPSQERRQRIRAEGVAERARLCLEFMTLVPEVVEAQAEAMACVLRLEQAHVRQEDAVSETWLAEVRSAYLTGRLEVANEQVRAITGEPTDPFNLTLH